MKTTIKTLAVTGAMVLGLVFTSTVHAQTRATDPHTYALSSRIVGGTLRLVHTNRYDDGSVTFSFEAKDFQGHSDGILYYFVNANNSSHSAAVDANTWYKVHAAKPKTGGSVRSYHSGGVWGYTEVGAEGCSVTMGYAYHRAAVVVGVGNANPTDCDWLPAYTGKVAMALARLIP